MNFGKGWVVFECINNNLTIEIDDTKRLISILPPRYTNEFISKFITQLYVDRHADWEDKLLHKKQKLAAIKPRSNGSVVYIGENILYMAIYCNAIIKNGSELHVEYSITKIGESFKDFSTKQHKAIISII